MSMFEKKLTSELMILWHFQTFCNQGKDHLCCLFRFSLEHRCRFVTCRFVDCDLVLTGKSTLVARFLGTDIGNLSTVGIALSEWHCKNFSFNIWDFGGQEEYYATHQCFMTERSLYLVLWNIMDGEKGINELRPWLDNIVARARKSPVLIVATHIDLLEEEEERDEYVAKMMKEVDDLTTEPQYKDRLNVDSITAVSCHRNSRRGIDNLKRMVYEAAEKYEPRRGQRVMGESVPASYHKLDRLIHARREELATKEQPPILREREVCDLMRRKGISDIDDEEELGLVAEFLHEVGSMLHYPDRNTGLADLYFIDPRWLCDMMSVVVTVRERNPYIRGGVLERSAVPMLFRDKRFPPDLFDQYLSLLNRFEIALSMDTERILIPSLLPDEPPGDVPDVDSCPSVVMRRHHRMLFVPAGFWSRLIARLLQQFQDVLQDLDVLADDWLGVGHLVKASQDTKSQPLPLSSSESTVRGPPSDAKSSICYWRHGLCFQHPRLFFMIRPLVIDGDRLYTGGVETITSVGPNGRQMMGLIVDEIHKLIHEWYQGLEGHTILGDCMKIMVPCTRCAQLTHTPAHIFEFESCADALVEGQIDCPNHVATATPLADLTPELLLLDMPQRFFLKAEDVACERDEDNKLGDGGFGVVYRGKVHGRNVAIKTYLGSGGTTPADMLKDLRQEVGPHSCKGKGILFNAGDQTGKDYTFFHWLIV